MKRSAGVVLLVGGMSIAGTTANALSLEAGSGPAGNASQPAARTLPARELGPNSGVLAQAHDRTLSGGGLPAHKKPSMKEPQMKTAPRGGFGSTGSKIGSARA